jgi:ankyrin repeat protein
VQFLLHAGSDPHAKNAQGWTAAMKAARGVHLKVAHYITDKTETPEYLGSLLLWAAEAGQSDVLGKCLRAGANVNFIDENGYTALMAASKRCHVDLVDNLIRNGSNINVADKTGLNTPLNLAIESGCVDVVRTLLNSSADPNYMVDEGSHPILTSVAKDNIKMLELLLSHGALVKGKIGSTALSWAIQKKNLPMVEALISHGAEVNFRNLAGEPPLVVAVRHHNREIVEYLISKGAKANASHDGSTGSSALIIAVIYGDSEMVRVLLEAGADVNSKSSDGSSALLLASKIGNLKTLTLLLNSGSHCSLVNKWGETAQSVAKNEDVRSLLKHFCQN